MKKHIIILFVVLPTVCSFAGDKIVEQILQSYQNKIDTAKEEAIKKLNLRMKAVMRSGDLEAAKEIEQIIAKLQGVEGDKDPSTDKIGGVPTFPGIEKKAKISVSGIREGKLKDRAKAFSNRDYTLFNVPEGLDGMNYTINAGGAPTDVKIKLKSPGIVYIAIQYNADDNDINALKDLGFNKTDMTMNYSDKGKTRLHIYSGKIKKSFTLKKANAWTGFILIYE